MRVRDIMTKDVVSCQLDTDLGHAAQLMLNGGFGTLPVVDADGRIAGIITDRDIAMAAAVRLRSASHIAVRDAMSTSVRSCFADDDISSVLKQMEEGRVRRLPVLNAGGHLAGIVSLDDIVVHALDRPGGVPAAVLINTLAGICAHPGLEPEVDYAAPQSLGVP